MSVKKPEVPKKGDRPSTQPIHRTTNGYSSLDSSARPCGGLRPAMNETWTTHVSQSPLLLWNYSENGGVVSQPIIPIPLSMHGTRQFCHRRGLRYPGDCDSCSKLGLGIFPCFSLCEVLG